MSDADKIERLSTALASAPTLPRENALSLSGHKTMEKYWAMLDAWMNEYAQTILDANKANTDT